jgi:hypothetical protein
VPVQEGDEKQGVRAAVATVIEMTREEATRVGDQGVASGVACGGAFQETLLSSDSHFLSPSFLLLFLLLFLIIIFWGVGAGGEGCFTSLCAQYC